MGRPLWFVAGAGVGVYAAARARRAAEALTADGLRDRVRVGERVPVLLDTTAAHVFAERQGFAAAGPSLQRKTGWLVC